VRRLTIRTTENCPVTLVHANADHVRVVVPHNPNGAGFAFYLAGGARLSHSSALIPATGELAVSVVNGRSLIEDSNLRAPFGVQVDKGRAIVRRSRITATFWGAWGAQGVSSISDSTVRIHGDGTGLAMDGCNGESRLKATNVTLIGDGTPGSVGVDAVSAFTSRGCAGHAAHAVLTSSIVRGFAVSLRQSRGSAGTPGQPPFAPPVSITTSYSDYDPSRTQTNEPGVPGAEPIHSSHDVNVDPRFMYAAGGEFRLRYDSPVIDRGADRAPGQLDLGRHPRSVDAHRAGDLIVDMGAFEYQGTGPRPLIGTRRTARVGERVAFRGDRSSDPDGGRLTYNWHFGDGSASADGAWVAHTFHHPGRYRVYLRVTDFAGQQAFTSKVIRITR
jgi:hypothetical protein